MYISKIPTQLYLWMFDLTIHPYILFIVSLMALMDFGLWLLDWSFYHRIYIVSCIDMRIDLPPKNSATCNGDKIIH